MSVRQQIATPDGKRQYVRRLFATIADRYDVATVVLSYGRDRHWKHRLADLATLRANDRALDLATGTGDIAFDLASRGARVVGLDLTMRMIEQARGKIFHGVTPAFLIGDMLDLPFPSGSFDLVTAGYGLRNVSDLPRALAEARRVLRPGGRMLSLDFNRPVNGVVRWTYLLYLDVVGAAVGWVLHRDSDTYRYIPASIRDYPGANGVSALMREVGFSDVACLRVLGGLMAIHRGVNW